MGKPITHGATRQDKVDSASKVARPGIDLYLPMSVHARSLRVKLPGGVKHDRLLPAFVSFTVDLAANNELVEDAAIWRTDVFLACQASLLDVFS